MAKLNGDIYDITETVKNVISNYIEEESEETLAVGQYGYLADISALQLQNSIIVGTQMGNELFPAYAKFDNNIIAHSILQNIEDINAIPSKMKIILGIKEEDLANLMVDNMFTIDANSPVHIESFEFHLPYDLIISRVELVNNEYIYSARYNITLDNPLSDITNPYLNTPFTQYYNMDKYIFFYTEIMQVEHAEVYKKIISSSMIENKTFQFDFINQLADFIVYVKDGDTEKYLTPIFDGFGVTNGVNDYVFYTYVDEDTIRVRFDSSSYIPSINADITVYIKTTKGEEGKFEYNTSFITNISSTNRNYMNLPIMIIPASNSEGGRDKKSTKELRNILPKEALSRGSITNRKDLQNYFNMLNIELNRFQIRQKVDNQFERSYYAYLLFKDTYDNVVPTNTIDLELARTDFDSNENRMYVLKPGTKILYDGNYGRILNDSELDLLQDDKTNFIYTIPFMMVVNGDPLYTSYYLSLINDIRYLEFSYINQKSVLQFISTNILWSRSYNNDPNIYKLAITISQNVNTNQNMIVLDKNGEVMERNVEVVAVFYNDEEGEVPYRYKLAEFVGENAESTYSYDFQFNFETDDVINDNNQVRIENLNMPTTGNTSYGYLNRDIKMEIYILVKLNDGSYGKHKLENILPEDQFEGYTVTNCYTVNDGLSFYKNYTEIVSSVATINNNINRNGSHTIKGFNIKSVPVVRYSYTQDEVNMLYIIERFNYHKAYIDNAMDILENNWLIDFKLFNTYGPSKIYSVDELGTDIIDRVNMTFTFRLKLLQASDKQTKEYIIKDVKDIIEDLNAEDDLHIPNLITTITNKYRKTIEYFEFVDFNGRGPGVQHLYRHEYDDVYMVPEFLTVHTNLDMSPDINIILD